MAPPLFPKLVTGLFFSSLYTSPVQKAEENALLPVDTRVPWTAPEFQNNVFPGSGELHCENNVEVAL